MRPQPLVEPQAHEQRPDRHDDGHTTRLTGQANFDGKESNARTLVFRVGSASGSGAGPLLIAGSVLVVLLAVMLWRWRRRGAGGPNPPASDQIGRHSIGSPAPGAGRRADHELVPSLPGAHDGSYSPGRTGGDLGRRRHARGRGSRQAAVHSRDGG